MPARIEPQFYVFMMLIAGLCLNSANAIAQEDCGSAIHLSIGTSASGDNIGALPDNDYSAQTSCNSANYEAAVWYSFTTPAGTNSLVFTFTAGTIGPNTVLTIVDDCTNSSSNAYLWYSCNGNSVPGATDVFCNLSPSTTYYIQVSTTAANAGTFDIEVSFNPLSPPNDFCDGAIVVFDGILDCGEFETLPGNPNACPDLEATGNCVDSNAPGVWYTFEVPDDMEYSAFFTNPLNTNFELFSTTSGCDDLQYEDCGGYILFSPTPGTTYYLLVENDLLIQSLVSVFGNDCSSPDNTLNTGDGMGGSDFGLNSCVNEGPIMPCQNDNVVWYSYTVGCANADLEISLDVWDVGNGQQGQIIDGGLMAIENDCSTIMSQYDMVNGDGYVCSAILGSDVLSLTDVPGGTTFTIAVGSDVPYQGYYEVTVMEDPYFDAILLNDDCVDAIELNVGLNPDLHNNCAEPDAPFIDCPPQGQATVWYEYTPTFDIEDITINVLPDDIISPAIGAYEACNGSVIAQNCGTTLELQCISETIYIDIGSTSANTGNFDLELLAEEAVEPPMIEFELSPICSYELSNIEISIPGGLSATIIVEISSTSSSDIMGMETHVFNDESFVIVDDELINCGSVTTDAVYLVTAHIDGFNCAAEPIEIPLPVFPKLEADPPDIEVCLPHMLNLDADDIIDGGTEPYIDYSWSWNGSDNLSNDGELIDYNLTQSGFIELEVIDNNGCVIVTEIPVEVHEPVDVELVIDNSTACPGSPNFIDIEIDLPIQGGSIVFSSWTILDSNGDPVSIGNESNSSLQIETDEVAPGDYFVSVIVETSFGCIIESDQVSFTIHPIPFGAIEIISLGDCQQLLQIVFYDSNGNDIYNNGPDFNNDGIPDLFDLNNDGIADFLEIIWYSPNSGIFSSDQLDFIPFEDGFYSAEFITAFNCIAPIMGLEVDLDIENIPSIVTPQNICENEVITLSVTPDNYLSYVWMNSAGIISGEGESDLIIDPADLDNLYSVEVLDQNGCTFQAMTSLDIHPAPEIQLTGSTSICPGQSTILDAGGDPALLTYEWYDSGENLLVGDSSSIELFLPDQYMLIVLNEFNCSDTLFFEVNENADLDIEIQGDDLCQNSTSTLDGGIGMDLYEWTNLGGDVLANEQSLITDTAGTYVLYVELGLCTGIDTITLNAIPEPLVNIPDSISICNGDNDSDNTFLNFDNIAMNSDPGQWTSIDLPANMLDDLTAVNFENVPIGDYLFVFTTSTAILPCENLTDTLLVSVSDCPCPSVEINDYINLCNDEDTFDLNDQILPSTATGTWIFLEGPTMVNIPSNAEIDIQSLEAGLYFIGYELDPLPMDGCPIRDTLTMEIISPPTVTMTAASDVCNVISPIGPTTLNLDDLILEGTGSWIDPMIPNLDFSDPTNLDFSGILPGEYELMIMTSNAVMPCDDQIFSVILTVLDCSCPIISVETSIDLCNDDASIDLNLYEGISDEGTWTAAPDNPASISLIGDLADLTESQAGSYNLIFTLNDPIDGCALDDTLMIQLHEPPIILEVRDTMVCNEDLGNGGTTINLNSLVVGDPGQWFDSDDVTILDPTNVDFANTGIGSIHEFTYETIDAVEPCMNSRSSIQITVIDCSCDEPVFDEAPILCNDASPSFDLSDLIITNHAGSWILLEQPAGSSDPLSGNLFVSENAVAGSYQVQFTMEDDPGFDCQQSWVFNIEVVDALSVVLINGDRVCTSNFNGDIASYDLFDAIESGTTEGYWLDANGEVVIEPTNLNFLDADPGSYEYTYIIENELPCENLILPFSLLAEPCSAEIIDTVLYLPNIFSPNGDGVNDEVFIESNIEDLMIKQFSIFDRWGELVFHTENVSILDPLAVWDGRFNGQTVSSGVYAYFIEADVSSSNGKNKFAGDITVVR